MLPVRVSRYSGNCSSGSSAATGFRDRSNIQDHLPVRTLSMDKIEWIDGNFGAIAGTYAGSVVESIGKSSERPDEPASNRLSSSGSAQSGCSSTLQMVIQLGQQVQAARHAPGLVFVIVFIITVDLIWNDGFKSEHSSNYNGYSSSSVTVCFRSNCRRSSGVCRAWTSSSPPP